MNNNDIVIRLRYALNIKKSDLIKVFALGGMTLDEAKVNDILTKQEPDSKRDDKLTMQQLEGFMNGLIISQRGQKIGADLQPIAPTFDMEIGRAHV